VLTNITGQPLWDKKDYNEPKKVTGRVIKKVKAIMVIKDTKRVQPAHGETRNQTKKKLTKIKLRLQTRISN